jgi:hypothetical protein
MPPSSPQDESSIRPPHPLAQRLIDCLRERPGSRVLDFCAGNGRNAAALRRAGYAVVAVPDAAAQDPDPLPASLGRFAAAVCTHGLLHGTTAAIARRVGAIAARLEPGAPFHAVFGSTDDARFGTGRYIEPGTFAPFDGDERDVAHTYFTRTALHAMLDAHFAIQRLEERAVDAIAGSWAHPAQPLTGAVHWFAIARCRAPADPDRAG